MAKFHISMLCLLFVVTWTEAQEPPKIAEEARLLTSTVGKTVYIRCDASGIPTPDIRWFKGGTYIVPYSSKHEISTLGSLIVHNLTEEDSGAYMCSATNDAGQATQERLLSIQVPPSVIMVPQIKEVLLNSTLELRCTAIGKPAPTIYWKRNDVTLVYEPNLNGQSVFIIHNVTPEDAGIYSCLALNPAGQASVSTTVKVMI